MASDFLDSLLNDDNEDSRPSSRRRPQSGTRESSNLREEAERQIDSEPNRRTRDRQIGDEYISNVRTPGGMSLNQDAGEDISLSSIRNRNRDGDRSSRRTSMSDDDHSRRSMRDIDEDRPRRSMRDRDIDDDRPRRSMRDMDMGEDRSRRGRGGGDTPFSNRGRNTDNVLDREGILGAILAGIYLLTGRNGNNPINTILGRLGLPMAQDQERPSRRSGRRERSGRGGRGGYEGSGNHRFSFFRFIVGTAGILVMLFVVLVVAQLNGNYNGNKTTQDMTNKLNSFIEDVSGSNKEGTKFKGEDLDAEEIENDQYVLMFSPDEIATLEVDENGVAFIERELKMEKVDKEHIKVIINNKTTRVIEGTYDDSGIGKFILMVDRMGEVFSVEQIKE